MTAKVRNCVFEGFLISPILIEGPIDVEIFETTMKECKTDGNGGAILCQHECKSVQISKACSEGCAASGDGQTMFCNISRDSYDVNINFSIITKSQSSGRFGIQIISQRCEIENVNFSFLKSSQYPSIFIDHTKNGCLVSYSEVYNATSSYSVLSVQEVDSSIGRNILTYVNILSNFGVDIVYVHENEKTTIQHCNIHNNDGTGYLFKISNGICAIEECSVQETYGGSTSNICNVPKDIQIRSSIPFEIDAPNINECGIIENIKRCSENNKRNKSNVVLMFVNPISPLFQVK